MARFFSSGVLRLWQFRKQSQAISALAARWPGRGTDSKRLFPHFNFVSGRAFGISLGCGAVNSARLTASRIRLASKFPALLSALAQEHAPHGPTEEHLVEEIAGVIWRKRRLRLARHRSPASAIRADKDGAGHSPTSKSGGSGSQQTDKRENAPPIPGARGGR